MRRHSWSGATAMVVLSLVAVACGEKGATDPTADPGAPLHGTSSPITLSKTADTVTVDQSLQLSAIIPPLPGSGITPITWTSSDANVAIVTQNGVVIALKSGKTKITVANRGVSASTNVTVRPTIRDVRFDSDTTAISLSESVKLPYRVTDSDGANVDLSWHTVSWASDSPEIAPLTAGASVTGRALGSTSVRLSVDGRTAITRVKVMSKPVAAISVVPSSLALTTGQDHQLTPNMTDVNGAALTGRSPSWNSSDNNVATVSSSGMVTARNAGSTQITANVQGKKAVVPVTVTASSSTPGALVQTVSVTLNASTLAAGQSTQATAVLKDASSNELDGRTIAWTTSDPTIATVSETGLVTAIRSGSPAISAMAEGKIGTAILTITPSSAEPTPVEVVIVALDPSAVLVGQSTQAKATLKDASGAVITDRSVLWVSSDASVGSVDGNGVVTSVKPGSVSITASAGGKTGSSLFTALAAKPAVHMISLTTAATTIKIGQPTQVIGVVRDVNGTVISGVPINWSTSSTSVATISTTGIAVGRGVGTATIYAKADTVTRSISINVIDSASATPSQPVTEPTIVGSSYGPATKAELPRLSVATEYPSMARQIRVPAGASLQAAINAAQPGDELLLAPGGRYIDNFVLPNKGSNTAWIVIRTDVSDAVIGAAGTRMTPSRAASANLAKILTPNNMSTISTTLGANHYRFTGVEIGATTASVDINAIVRFGTDEYSQNSAATTANHLIVDRSYVHGSPTLEVRRCVLLNSATSAVIDSWLADCHSNVSDSQAIVGWNGPGPFLIQNNHLEAGHEVICFGGGTFTVTNGSPSDITIRGNHLMRPLAWKGVWQAKNLFETKHAKRLLLEGNVLENNWADAQAGFAILIKSVNQQNDNPWTQSADLTIRYNRIRNTGSAFNLSGTGGDGLPDQRAARVTVHDNFIENVNVSPYNADGIAWQMLNGISDVAVFHNTTLELRSEPRRAHLRRRSGPAHGIPLQRGLQRPVRRLRVGRQWQHRTQELRTGLVVLLERHRQRRLWKPAGDDALPLEHAVHLLDGSRRASDRCRHQSRQHGDPERGGRAIRTPAGWKQSGPHRTPMRPALFSCSLMAP